MIDKKQKTTEDPLIQMRQELDAEDNRVKSVAASCSTQKSKIVSVIESCLFAVVIIILSFILFSVLSAKADGKTPEVFGYRLYVIESGSMDPTLRVGALILSHRPKDASDLKKDDIITFISSKGKTITHRIVEEVVSEDGSISYRTKGDNPINSPDNELVTPKMVEAVFILKIPLT